MTPAQAVTFFDGQATQALGNLEIARSRGYPGVSFLLGSAFQAALMSGLIQWRTRLTNPEPALKRVLEITSVAGEEFAKAGPAEDHWRDFPFETACLIGIALGVNVDGLLPKLPGGESFSWWPGRMVGHADVALVTACREGREPAGWQLLLDRIRRQKGSKSIGEAWDAYMRVALAVREADLTGMREAAVLAEAFFRERPKMSKWGQTDGGTRFENSMVADYRLAAALGPSSPPDLPDSVKQHAKWW